MTISESRDIFTMTTITLFEKLGEHEIKMNMLN